MKDLIDERNFRERCARSIVKGYNARYVPVSEPAAQDKQGGDADGQGEKPWDDEKLAREKKWAKNPSYEYGKKKDNDPVTEEQIQKILGEQKVDVMDTIDKDAIGQIP